MYKRLVAIAAILGAPAAASMAVASGPDPVDSAAPQFVEVLDIVAPVIDSGRMAERLRFGVIIRAVDENAAARLRADAPRLRSSLLLAGIEYARLHVSALSPVNAEGLAKALDRSVRRGHPDVDRVLVISLSAEFS
jgi:hypothetical protein